MEVVRALFSSRKFVTALGAVIVSILVSFGVPEEMAGPLITAIMVLAAAYIGGTALEDAAFKSGGIVIDADAPVKRVND